MTPNPLPAPHDRVILCTDAQTYEAYWDGGTGRFKFVDPAIDVDRLAPIVGWLPFPTVLP